MRRDYERKNTETDKEYYSRMALVIAELRNEGNEPEAKDAYAEVLKTLYFTIEEVAIHEANAWNLDEETKLAFSTNVQEMIARDFYKYNNPDYLEESGSQYEIKTFIKSRILASMCKGVAEGLDISTYGVRLLNKIRKTRAEIMAEQCLSEDAVSVDMIWERLDGKIKKKTIMNLLIIEKGRVSFDVMVEKGDFKTEWEEFDDSVYGTEMDTDDKAILDEALSKMSDLDVYIMMNKLGLLNEDGERLEMPDLARTDLFIKLLERDETVRAVKDPVKTGYNKQAKINKLLLEAGHKLNLKDVKNCLREYFLRYWEQIEK